MAPARTLTLATPSSTEIARTAVVRRVTVSTLIAVFSTLLCYVNFVAGFANWLVMMPSGSRLV